MKQLETASLLATLKEDAIFLLEQVEMIGNGSPMELLEQPDGPGRWNTLQVLDHLNSYYRYYIPLMMTLVEKTSTTPAPHFQPGWLGNYFTQSMLPREGRVKNKMKAMKGHRPDSKLNGLSVLQEFLDWQRKFVLLIGLSERADLNTVRVPISIASFLKLKLGDVLMFITAHNQRHWVQIEKLLGRYPVALA